MSDHWDTGHEAEVARDRPLDALFQCDCFGRAGSGSSICCRGARFALERLSGLIGGPRAQG
eukprot:5170325-Pyramimonas_sp.AAC.1